MLIEREAAIAMIEQKQKELCPVGMFSRNAVYGTDRDRFDAWDEIIDQIDALPTTGAAPVVQCKSCQYFRPNEPNGETCANISGMTEPSEDDYCSRWLARMGGEGREAD